MNAVEGWVVLCDMPAAFPAEGFGEYWNGWATPSFSEETGRAIVSALCEWYGNSQGAREYRSADGQACVLVAYGDAEVAISDAAVALASSMTAEAAYADFLIDPVTGLELESHGLTTIGWASWVWERFDSEAEARAAVAGAAR